MSQPERLTLARVLSGRGDTLPDIFRILELVEQRPLTEKEREEVKEYLK